MTSRRVFHCIVDDTVLITNISEVKKWVLNGSITLTLPIHTLERLALLKQDSSQIGSNARKTVEFLDNVTEGRDGLPVSAISLQGPAEKYEKWSEVEKHMIAQENQVEKEAARSMVVMDDGPQIEESVVEEDASGSQPVQGTANVLSRILLNKLNFAKESDLTPPTSPGSSNDRSLKNSPESLTAKPNRTSVVVPHSLEPLVNAVVWQSRRGDSDPQLASDTYFISNSADTASLMRNFGIKTRDIHQLRQVIGLEDLEIKNQSKYIQKHLCSQASPSANAEAEPQSMLKYEDGSEEELVFKPRGRGSRPWHVSSASSSPKMDQSSPVAQPTSSNRRSSRTLAEHQAQKTAIPMADIPTEEIDPNSFDRGSFGRANKAREIVGEGNVSIRTRNRGSLPRGNVQPRGPLLGFSRGAARGGERGASRGRGRLFVP